METTTTPTTHNYMEQALTALSEASDSTRDQSVRTALTVARDAIFLAVSLNRK